MITVMQIICLLMTVVYSGQSFKANLTRFDKTAYIIVAIAYLGTCILLQGAK